MAPRTTASITRSRKSCEYAEAISPASSPAGSLMMWTPPHRPAAMMPIDPKRDG
jgi:hypothetical protein